jgi:DNA helicase-2/ATP-dependent DNA helicase PcrA
LIRHNTGRLGKDLKTANENDGGEPIYVKTFETDKEEAEKIADAIALDGAPYNNKTILIRSAGLSRLFEKELYRLQIPYCLIGDTKIYDRKEIRDVIAYARLLTHPFDDMSFLRIIGKPSRGFGSAAIKKIREYGPDLMTGLRACPFKGKQAESATKFLSIFDFDWENMSPADAVQKLLDDSGYIKMWQESKDPEASNRLIHIQELKSDIAEYDSLNEFLEQAELRITEDGDGQNNNSVNIMTIHAAKGAEFDNVFLPAFEENIFPNKKSINEGSLEEERRLAYVALTRAKKHVFITNAISRVIYDDNGPQYKRNEPSRFISEIDSEYLYFGNNNIQPRVQTYNKNNFVKKKNFVPRATLVGKVVKHSEYGTGVVIEEGTGILTIAFGSRGIKKIARDFVELV